MHMLYANIHTRNDPFTGTVDACVCVCQHTYMRDIHDVRACMLYANIHARDDPFTGTVDVYM